MTTQSRSSLSFRQSVAVIVVLLVVLSGTATFLALRAIAQSESLLQRTLASYAQLEAFTALENAINRDLLGASVTTRTGQTLLSHPSKRVEQAFQNLRDLAVRELLALDSVQARQSESQEQGNLTEISEQYAVAKTAFLASGENFDGRAFITHYGSLVSLIQRYREEESDEITASLQTLESLRHRTSVLILLTTLGPMALIALLLRQLVGKHQILQQLVDARTEELAERVREIAAADANRRLFFAKLSHELRTPLTVLLADAELGKSSSDVERKNQSLVSISVKGRMIKRRVNDLLALSRSEAGEVNLNLSPVELSPLLLGVCELAKGYAEEKEIDLLLDRSAVAGVELLADKEWLEHALLALIDNAIKASSCGQRVTVMARPETNGAPEVTVEVQDQGAGAAPEQIEQLIEPFAQQPGDSSYTGSGLGLAVVRWVTREHDGRLELRNGSERGFVAAMSLPTL